MIACFKTLAIGEKGPIESFQLACRSVSCKSKKWIRIFIIFAWSWSTIFLNKKYLSHQEWIQEAQFPPITKQQPLIIAAGDIQYPEIVLHYTNSQTNRHMPPQDIVASCACGEGEGVPNKSDCSSKLWGGVRNISVLLQNWGGGYETYISVVTKLRGTKHIRLGAK